MIRLVHQPGEVVDVSLGVVAAQAGPVAQAARGLVSGAAALLVAATVPLDRPVELRVSGGTDGETYLLTTPLELADGTVREVEVEVACVDGRWTMPDGGAPMLSAGEFVDAVGLDEAVRLTDGSGAGRIDAAVLTGALVAAQGQVEAALGDRAIPAPVPQVLKTAIADLARLRLYPGEAPDGVKAAAATSARYLDRLAAGTAKLPGTAVEPPANDPVLIRPGRTTYPDDLAGFGFR